MLEYNLDIADQSVWTIVTPSAAALSMPFYLTEIGLFHAGREYYTIRSERTGYYLLYTSSGCGMLEYGGIRHSLPAGTAILVDCRPLHRYLTDSEPWVNYWIHLDGAGVSSYYDILEQTPVPLPRTGRMEELFDSLLNWAPKADVVCAAKVSDSLSSLLTELLTCQMGENRTILHAGIQAAVDFIRDNYSAPITIDDITRSAGLSKFHFVRLFSRYTGSTPYRYLINHRINRSKELLCTTDLSVARISAMVGYQSESNFIQQFGRLCSMTPAQFRRQNLSYVSPLEKEQQRAPQR